MRRNRNSMWVVVLGMLALGLTSCVDVPSTGPTPPELVADFRFINGSSELGEVSIEVDDQQLGTIGFAEATERREFLAGTRIATLSNGDEINISMPTERRGTIVLLGLDRGVRTILRLAERQRFNDPMVGDIMKTLHVLDAENHAVDSTISVAGGKYRFVNIFGEDPVNLQIAGTEPLLAGVADTIAVEGHEASLGSNDDPGYWDLANGTYNVTVTSADSNNTVLASTSITVASMRQTTFLMRNSDGTTSILNVEDN